MENNTSIFYYNNLSMILMNLDSSIALIDDFENWNSLTDKYLEKLKDSAQKNNLKTTLFVLYDDETNYKLFDSENIIKKAREKNIDYVIFYVLNQAIDFTDQKDLYNNIHSFLNIKNIILSKNYDNKNCLNLSKSFWINFFQVSEEEINDSYKKDIENNLQLLKQANFKEFKKINNLDYQFSGRIGHGQKIGRTIGFPTINIYLDKNLPIEKAVYACQVYVESLDKYYLGAGCYWSNNQNKDVFEVYIKDFDQEIYEWKVIIKPIAKIRNNIKVENIEKLKQLLENDCQELLKYKINL